MLHPPPGPQPTSSTRVTTSTNRKTWWPRPLAPRMPAWWCIPASWCRSSARHVRPRSVPNSATSRPSGCARCCWPSRKTCGWCCCAWPRACRRCATLPPFGASARRTWPRSRSRCLRPWPVAWASGRSNGSWKTSPSASCSPRPITRWPGCWTSVAWRVSSGSRPFAPSWPSCSTSRACVPKCRAGPNISTASGRRCRASRWTSTRSSTCEPCGCWWPRWPTAIRR